MSKIFLVTGMHRSGTSLFSNWLNNCGVNLGDKFLDDEISNPTGFYEDKKFVSLHKDILNDNNKNHFTLDDNLIISEDKILRAQKLLIERKNIPIWGWKDPRSILLLDFWNKMVEDLNFIFLFRNPDEVINSLERRMIKNKDFIFRSKYYLLHRRSTIKLYAESWIFNNLKILSFIEKIPKEKYILLDIKSFKRNDKAIFLELNSKFELSLNYSSLDKIIKPNLLKEHATVYKLAKETRKRIGDTFESLKHKETIFF